MKVKVIRISTSKVIIDMDDNLIPALDGEASVEEFDAAYEKMIQLAEDTGLELDEIDYDFEVE